MLWLPVPQRAEVDVPRTMHRLKVELNIRAQASMKIDVLCFRLLGCCLDVSLWISAVVLFVGGC